MKPTHENTVTYYDSIAAGYNELHGEEQRKKYTLIAQALQLAPDAVVLDVGAGTGIGHDIIPSLGVDPSQELLKQHPDPRSVVASAEALPFPDKSFDAAICVTAIHHTDYHAAIRELLRVSRGPVAISVLKKSPQTPAIMAAFMHACKPVRVLDEEKDHVLIYDPRPFRASERGTPPVHGAQTNGSDDTLKNA